MGSAPEQPSASALERYHDAQGAARYGEKYGRSMTRRGTHWRETAILRRMLLRFGPAASILNVPCGAGRFADILAGKERSRVVFADSSQAMLDAAREETARTAPRPVELLLLDATGPPATPRFDVVVCVRLLHHLGDPAFGAALDFLAGSAKAAIVCTFASSGTWKGFWRSLRQRLGLRARGEAMRSPAAMKAGFSARGWRVDDVRRVNGFFSTQTWLLLVPATR